MTNNRTIESSKLDFNFGFLNLDEIGKLLELVIDESVICGIASDIGEKEEVVDERIVFYHFTKEKLFVCLR